MSNTTLRHDAAFAATVPMALTALAEHIADHNLPTPGQLTFMAPLVGETIAPAVQVILDSPTVDSWLESLDERGSTVHADHPVGTWHDVHGIANTIRVKVSWYTVNTRFAPTAPMKLVVVVDHETCADTDCDRVLCYCHGRQCPGTFQPGCDHAAAFVCAEHRSACDDCVAL